MAAFVKLLNTPADIARVTKAIEDAIAKSFETHPLRHMTRAEVKRRFEMCAKIFETLRSDCQWSVSRALDKLLGFLRAELDGRPWKPEARSIWTPDEDDNERLVIR